MNDFNKKGAAPVVRNGPSLGLFQAICRLGEYGIPWGFDLLVHAQSGRTARELHGRCVQNPCSRVRPAFTGGE